MSLQQTEMKTRYNEERTRTASWFSVCASSVSATAAMMMVTAALTMITLAWEPVVALTITAQVGRNTYPNGGATAEVVTDNAAICGPADFGVQQVLQDQLSTGQVITVGVLCHPVRSSYLVSFLAVIPEDGRTLASTTYVNDNPARVRQFNNSATFLYNPSPVTGRQLLDFQGPYSLRCGKGDNDCHTTGLYWYPYWAVSVRYNDGDGDVSGAALALASCLPIPIPPAAAMAGTYATFTDNDGHYYNQSCYNNIANNRFDIMGQLQDDSQGTTQSFQNWVSDYRAYEFNASALLVSFGATDQTILGYQVTLNQTISTLGAMQNQAETTQQLTNATLNAALANQTNNIAATKLLLINGSTLLFQLAQSDQNNENILSASIWNDSATTAAASQQLAQFMQRNRQFLFSKLQDAQQSFMTFTTSIQRFILNEDLVNSQAWSTQKLLATPTFSVGITGLPLQPFLEDLGNPPIDNPYDLGPLYSTLPTAKERVRGAVQDSSSPTQYFGIQSWITVRCGSVFFVERAPAQPDGLAMFQLLGPSGCDASFNDTVPVAQRCLCYATIEETRCPLTLGNLTNWQLDDGLSSEAFCATPLVPFAAGYNGTLVRSLGEYAQYWANVTQRGLASPSGSYRILDIFTNTVAFVPFSSELANPSNFLALVQDYGDSLSGLNAAYFFYQMWASSWVVAYGNIDAYRAYIFGTPPNYMTQTKIQYDRQISGELGPGWTFTAMMYSLSFLTYSLLIPTAPVAQIDITVQGQPLVTIDASANINNPNQNLLPGVQPIAWDPVRFPTTLWNIPAQGKTPLKASPYPGAMANTPAYAAFQNPSQATRDQWQAIYEQEFDHTAGGHLASVYEKTLDSTPGSLTQGMCVTPTQVFEGTDCLVRENFQVSISGSVWNNSNVVNTMIFTHTTSVQVNFQFTTPRGALSQQVESVCPTLLQYAEANNVLLVLLTNSDAVPNFFLIRQEGACPFAQEITLQPGAQFVLHAPACPLSPPGVPDVLVFWYQNTALVPTQFSLCPQSIPLNYTSQTLSQFVGAATLGYYAQIVTNRVNTALLAMRQLRLSLSQSLYTTAPAVLTQESLLGFRISAASLESTSQFLVQLAAINAQATASANAMHASANADITSQIADSQAIFAALSAQEARDQVILAQEVATLERQNAANSAALNGIVGLANAVGASMSNTFYYLGQFATGANAVVNASIQGGLGAIETTSNTDLTDLSDAAMSLQNAVGNVGTDAVGLLKDVSSDPATLLGLAFNGPGTIPRIFGVIIFVGVLFVGAFMLYWFVQCIRGRRSPIYTQDEAASQRVRAKIAQLAALQGTT